MIVCLLGARYRDFYQLVPIFLQLVFLLSPILYQKSNLGAMAWTANLNPLTGTQSGSPFTYVWRGAVVTRLFDVAVNTIGLF